MIFKIVSSVVGWKCAACNTAITIDKYRYFVKMHLTQSLHNSILPSNKLLSAYNQQYCLATRGFFFGVRV